MADIPKPNQQGAAGEEHFKKMFAKVGLKFDPATEQEMKKALTPISKYMSDFSKTTDMKNTFFGKLPGIKQMLQNLKPDTARFTEQMATMGYASKLGADNNQEFYRSLNFVGKGLSLTIGKLVSFGAEGNIVTKMLTGLVSFGLSMFVEVLALALQGLKNIVAAAIAWQDVLNDFSKMMGGIAHDRILRFNEAVNMNLKALSGYGFALGDFIGSFKAYITNGLNPAIATNVQLTKTTLQLAAVTGESVSEMATFWAGIQRGSRLAVGSFKDMGNTFTEFNASVERTGVIGTISFSKFKEAVTSSGTALLIAASKGQQFTKRLSGDLNSLAGFAQALNVSVSELNAKFEESANLISSPDSPFRALLAISGGGNIQNMLGNQFNRTEAMLKISDKLSVLTAQFGGNLNIMGQVAEQAFGISKDMAIKFATMTAEQKKALRQAQQDSMLMKSGGLEKSWQNVSTTLTSVWERFKNTIMTMFQRAFVGGPIQKLLASIGERLGKYLTDLSNPESSISKLVSKMGDILGRFFGKADDWLKALDPMLDKFAKWIEDVATVFLNDNGKGGIFAGIIKILRDTLVDVLWPIFKLGAEVIGISITHAIRMGLKGFLGGYSKEERKVASDQYQQKMIALFKTFSEEFGIGAAATEKNNKILSKSNEIQEISNKLAKIKEEESRYNAFKDTDLVIGKDGQFTLAGLERNKLEDKKEQLEEERRQREIKDSENIQILADKAKTEAGHEAARQNYMAEAMKPVPAGTPVTTKEDIERASTRTARRQASWGF